MRTFAQRFHLLLFLFLLSTAFLSAACGKGGSDARSGEASKTLPMESTVLRLSALTETPAIDAAVGDWARREGVELEITGRSSSGGSGASEGSVRPFSLVESEDGEGTPWLLQPHGLLVRLDRLRVAGWDAKEPVSWSDLQQLVSALARAGSGLALPEDAEGLHRIFLPLWWGAQAETRTAENTGMAERLDSPEAIEALAFLVQLSRKALLLPAAELDGAFLSGEVTMLPCSLSRAQRIHREDADLDLAFWPWPSPTGEGKPQALARVRSWILPAGAAYRDLAEKLGGEFGRPGIEEKASKLAMGWVPFHASSPDPLVSAGLRAALRPWPASPSHRSLARQIGKACAAALELRRSPAAALEDAQAEGS